MDPVELKIITEAAKGLLAAGYRIDVWDSEEWVLRGGLELDAILSVLGETDEEFLCCYTLDDSSPPSYTQRGQVYLVHGNGADVICDYTCRLENALSAAESLAESLASVN